MHGNGPKMLIIARREASGGEMPDFSGESWPEARQSAMHSCGCGPMGAEEAHEEPKDESPVPQSKDDAGIESELRSIADRLGELATDMGESGDSDTISGGADLGSAHELM